MINCKISLMICLTPIYFMYSIFCLFIHSYTATGHDLSDGDQRIAFFTGLERERYKIEQCIEKLGGTPNSQTTLGNTQADKDYKLKIKEKLNACDNMGKFGDILREPAPFGEW